MPTHLYCLLPRGAELSAPELEGIGGAPVRAIDAGAVTAWVSTLPDPATPADALAIRAHDAVTTAALALATPLPARFGQRFDSDEACRSALERRESALSASLEAVAGCVEMRLLLAPPPAPAPPAGRPRAPAGGESGRAYLERVRSRIGRDRILHERAASIRAALLAAAGALALRDAVAVRPGSAVPVAVAHLVRRGDADAWRAAAEGAALAFTLPGERIVVAGPVAPYSFAEIADVAAG